MDGRIALALAPCKISVASEPLFSWGVNLALSHQPPQQTGSERLHNDRTPGPLPTSYPDIYGGDLCLNVTAMSRWAEIRAPHGADGKRAFRNSRAVLMVDRYARHSARR